MSLEIYTDVHVDYAIVVGLRNRGVDVLRAQEDGAGTMDDPDLLDRAMALGRVLFSQDEDLLREGARRQQTGEPFAGIIYSHQLGPTIGQCIADLELLAKLEEPDDFLNRVEYLPL